MLVCSLNMIFLNVTCLNLIKAILEFYINLTTFISVFLYSFGDINSDEPFVLRWYLKAENCISLISTGYIKTVGRGKHTKKTKQMSRKKHRKAEK